jgi:hypothetical protein
MFSLGAIIIIAPTILYLSKVLDPERDDKI